MSLEPRLYVPISGWWAWISVLGIPVVNIGFVCAASVTQMLGDVELAGHLYQTAIIAALFSHCWVEFDPEFACVSRAARLPTTEQLFYVLRALCAVGIALLPLAPGPLHGRVVIEMVLNGMAVTQKVQQLRFHRGEQKRNPFKTSKNEKSPSRLQ